MAKFKAVLTIIVEAADMAGAQKQALAAKKAFSDTGPFGARTMLRTQGIVLVDAQIGPPEPIAR